jgi:aldose 1-epimerase
VPPIRLASAAGAVLLLLACAAPAHAQRYSATRDGDTVTLADRQTDTVVTVVPSVGNIATGMRVKGHDVLRYRHASLADFKARPGQTGIPFMGPWIGRLDEQAFYANGRRHAFDMSLDNVRGEVPIHGFLTATDQWRVTALEATPAAAGVDAAVAVRAYRGDHLPPGRRRARGGDGGREPQCRTDAAVDRFPPLLPVDRRAARRLADRRGGQDAVAARRTQVAHRPDRARRGPAAGASRRPARVQPDEVFTDLVRDGDGRSTMTVWGKAQRLDVVVGPRYTTMVVWAPHPSGKGRGGQGDSPAAERNFICFEPMAALANGLNMAHRGQYKALQSILPGETWRESFWVRPSGFTAAR